MSSIKKEKSLFRRFLTYLVPSISAMWFFSIYTMIDGIFVGRGVGPLALASVNLAMPFINTVFAVSLLISVSSSTMITYYLGKGNKTKGNEIFTLNFIVLGTLGILITIFSLVYLDNIANFLGATDDTIHYVKDYLRIIIISSTFFMLAYSLEVLVKADGFPIYSIVFVTVAAITNIILDYILVIHFDFGIRGAAIATGMSQLTSFIGFLTHFIFGKSNLKFVKPSMNFGYIKKMFVIGFPESLTELSAGFIIFIFNFFIIRTIGENGLAAFSVIMYINNLAIMTMIAINQAMQPLVSFFNGREEKLKVQKLFNMSLKTAVFWGFVFFIGSQLFTENLIRLFISPDNTEVFEIAYYGLRIFSFGFLVSGINIVISGYFTALKDTKRAALISVLRGYVFITISLVLFTNIFGEVGIWFSPIINELLTLLVSIYILSLASKKNKIRDEFSETLEKNM